MTGYRTGLILISWLALAGLAQAAMYKWVDENGVTQYTQYPPPNQKSETIVPPPTPAQDPAGAHQKLEQTLQKLDEDSKARANAEAEREKSAAAEQQRKQNCQAARSNLEKLTTGGRKRVIGPDGTASYLSEEDRQARITEAKKQVDEYCSRKK